MSSNSEKYLLFFALFVIRKGYPAQRPLSIKSSSCGGAEKAFFRFVRQTGYPAPLKHPVCFLSYSHQFRDLFADDIRGLNDRFQRQMRVAVRDRIAPFQFFDIAVAQSGIFFLRGQSQNPLCACVRKRKHLFFLLSVVGNCADCKQSLKQTGSEPSEALT